jgi:hypothetical protein
MVTKRDQTHALNSDSSTNAAGRSNRPGSNDTNHQLKIS